MVFRIQSLTAAEAREVIDDLTLVLQDGVASGVSFGFLTPLDDSTVRRYWQDVIAQLEAGTRVLLVARAVPGFTLFSPYYGSLRARRQSP